MLGASSDDGCGRAVGAPRVSEDIHRVKMSFFGAHGGGTAGTIAAARTEFGARWPSRRAALSAEFLATSDGRDDLSEDAATTLLHVPPLAPPFRHWD